MRQGQDSLLFPAAVGLAGVLVGVVSAILLRALLRRMPHLTASATIGHLLCVPPAVQVGNLAGRLAAQYLATAGEGEILVTAGYAAAAVTGASTVLAVGSMIGAAVGAALNAMLGPVWRRVGPRVTGMLPSGWRAVRITLLLAALAGALLYAQEQGGLPRPEAQPPQFSHWIEREKAIFRSVLTAERYDVLVLPLQDDGRSFDHAARSLMTRYLSRRIKERTGRAMPDPTILARALDSRARRIDLADAQRMAESVGARTLVVSEVRRSGETFDIRGRVWMRDGDKEPWREGASGAIGKVPFHDRLPPSVAFRDTVDTLLDQMKLGASKPANATNRPLSAARILPNDLLRLASLTAGSPVDRALRLQVMASLHVRESLEASALWERALVALWDGPASPLNRVLEARAYLHLSRRPYALEKLKEADTPAERALVAVLNGDVPGVEAAVSAIEDPALRLMTEIELADLYEAYDLYPRLAARRKTLLENPLTEPIALSFRLSAPDWFSPDVHANVAGRLQEIAPHVDYLDQARAWLSWLYWNIGSLTAHGLRLARSVEKRYASIWREQGAQWLAHPGADQLAPWDYYDLLFALNRAGVVKSIRAMVHNQDLPQQAADLIEALGDTFRGHPWLTYLHAIALDSAGRKLPLGATQEHYFYRSSALAVAVYQWEQGESFISASAEHLIFERKYEKYSDEPIKWYRGEVAPLREYIDRIIFGNKEIERSVVDARRRLEYSDRYSKPLSEVTQWLRRAGKLEEAVAAVEANRHRFVGTLNRVRLIAEASDSDGRGELPIALYQELLKLDPDSQTAYQRLAQAHLEAGRPDEAQRVYLSFPGFEAQGAAHNPVALSNYAQEAGQFLYLKGYPEQAVGLFVRAAKSGTGAASQMYGREILALMDNDMPAAVREARIAMERYNDSWATMRHTIYLALMGDYEQADATLRRVANRITEDDIWIAAYVTHRVQGIEGPGLQAWLESLAEGDILQSYQTKALRERHAFMLAVTDRAPSGEALASVRRAAAVNNQSPFYARIADGYIALRRGDFATAADKLRSPHNDLFNISATRREQLSELLPYLTWAYLRSGKADQAEKMVRDHLINLGTDSDYLIARALLKGAGGDHEAALVLLKRAFVRLPSLQTRAFFPGYILLEACEFLFEASGSDAYRETLEDLARRLQVNLPYAWAAAFEAKYAQEAERRQLAIAAASILDPKSHRIAHVAAAERAALRNAALRHSSTLGAALRYKATRVR
ncbi:MAG: tetratricopeptide repeat protein [Betaproteobacteria bacterium]|nr:tetratricopeptide repeat protein [Betaproteobacteria bacterium]